jgi:hypothetical protein
MDDKIIKVTIVPPGSEKSYCPILVVPWNIEKINEDYRNYVNGQFLYGSREGNNIINTYNTANNRGYCPLCNTMEMLK